MSIIKGWEDAVVGYTLVKRKRHVVYDCDRAVVMWERRGLSHRQSTHMVVLAMNVPGRRIWVRPASADDLREAAAKRAHEAKMRKLKGDSE